MNDIKASSAWNVDPLKTFRIRYCDDAAPDAQDIRT